MKHSIILAIALIFLVGFASCAKFTRTEKKVKKAKVATATKDGGGSWALGFDCPEIRCALGNGSLNTDSKGTFYPTTMENPTNSNDKIGMKWKLSSAGAIMKALTFTNGGYYYLPYRLLSSSFTYTNPWGGNKYIQGWITSDDGKAYQCRFVLPYATFTYYINDDEGNKIVNLLGKHRTRCQDEVTSTKSAATNAASEYITNKPICDAASASEAEYTKTIADTQKRLDEIKAQIKTLQTQLEAAEAASVKATTDAKAKEGEINTLTNQINNQSNQIQSNETTLKELEGKTTASADEIAKLKSACDNSMNLFNSEVEILRGEAPQRKNELDAVVAANTALKSADVSSNLNKIAPISN